MLKRWWRSSDACNLIQVLRTHKSAHNIVYWVASRALYVQVRRWGHKRALPLLLQFAEEQEPSLCDIALYYSGMFYAIRIILTFFN